VRNNCNKRLCDNSQLIFFATAYDLNVTVVSTPIGPEITAARTLSFRCDVTGGTGVYQYQWSSNCSHDCFVNSQTTQSVVQDALHSTDSGIYTCVAMDDAGNSGSDSVGITVIGMCIRFRLGILVSFRCIYNSSLQLIYRYWNLCSRSWSSWEQYHPTCQW